ncbi:MAG: energy-coupling factor transporter transmembrane component T, partial [Dehalococcoidia bacterium]
MPRSEFAKKTLLGVVPADSPFYGFHPVTRLMLLVVLSVAPIFIDRPEINLGIIAVTFGLFWWGRVRMADLKKYRVLLVTVALFMFIVAFLAPGDTARLTPFKLAGLTLYFETMSWAFVSYVAGLSLRSAGMFMEDFATIREAEQARALDLDALSFREKVKLYTMYTVPLFAVALRRADEISAALYARGYTLSGRPGTGGRRTDYLRDRFVLKTRDWIVSFGLLAG